MSVENEGRTLLERATVVSDLRAAAVEPFTLHVKQVALIYGLQLDYVLHSAGPKYRLEVTSGNQNLLRIGDGKTIWRNRRMNVPIVVVDDAGLSSWNTAAALRTAMSGRIKDVFDSRSNVGSRCVKVQNRDGSETDHCIDPKTGALQSSTRRKQRTISTLAGTSASSIAETRVTTYGEYQHFSGVLVPGLITWAVDGRIYIEERITSIAPLDPSAANFSPEPGMEAWPACEPRTLPVPFPQEVTTKQAEVMGRARGAFIQVIISPAGKVTETHTVSERNPGSGAALEDIFKKANFRPGRCGDIPVQSELLLTP